MIESGSKRKAVFSSLTLRAILLSGGMFVLGACGGGSGGSTVSPPPPPPPPPSNSAPTFTGATDFTFQENQAVQFTLAVTDADGDTITISDDTSGDGAFFTVDVSNGNVTANTPDQSFNFEAPQDVNGDNVYEQNITLSDGTTSTTTTITVTITDVNEPPVCGPTLVTDFEENFAGVIFEFAGASSDPEGTSPTGYDLDGVGRTTNVTQESLDKFVLDTVTGELSLSEGLDAEFEGVEGEYEVSVSTIYGTEFVQCQQRFQIVDVPGVVTSGVKITGNQNKISAIGDVDGDGLTDFFLSRPIFDADIEIQQPEGYVIFGKTLSDALAINGAETLAIESLDTTQFVKLVGTYTDPDAEFDGNTFGAVPLGDLNADGQDELIVVLEPYEDFASESGFVAGRPLGYIVWGSVLSSQIDGEIDMSALALSEGISIFGQSTINLNRQRIKAAAGDFDADGLPDAAFAMPFQEDGLMYIVTGATLTANTNGSYEFDDRTSGESAIITNEFNGIRDLGFSVGTLPDIDADAGEELVASSSETAFVIKSSALISAIAANASVNFSNLPDAQVASFNTFSSSTIGAAPGDADNDGLSDLILGFGQSDSRIGALVYGDTIATATRNNPVDLLSTNTVDDFVLFSNSAFTDNAFKGASFLGDIDGDDRDDFAIRISPSFEDGGLYVVLASGLDSVGADHEFDLNTLANGDGLRIFDSSDSGFFHEFAALSDSDNDALPDIYIAAGKEGYFLQGSEILSLLTAGTTDLDLQANFNDETSP